MSTARRSPAHRAGTRRPRILPAAVVAAAVAAVAVWALVAAPVTMAGVGAGLEALRGDWPRSVGGTTRPAAAAGDPGLGSSYAFTGMPGQDIVAFDPCDPVRYVLSGEGPAGSDEIVFSAVREIAAATGLEFMYEGTSEERPSTYREKYQPEVYGDRWAPVLIAWSDPDEVSRLGGRTAGLGGSTPVKAGSQPWVYVTGQVMLDGPQLAPLLGSPDGDATVKAVIVHELAHVAGLAHVDSPLELMSPHTTGPASLGAGDLEGLAVLGRGACVAEY